MPSQQSHKRIGKMWLPLSFRSGVAVIYAFGGGKASCAHAIITVKPQKTARGYKEQILLEQLLRIILSFIISVFKLIPFCTLLSYVSVADSHIHICALCAHIIPIT